MEAKKANSVFLNSFLRNFMQPETKKPATFYCCYTRDYADDYRVMSTESWGILLSLITTINNNCFDESVTVTGVLVIWCLKLRRWLATSRCITHIKHFTKIRASESTYSMTLIFQCPLSQFIILSLIVLRSTFSVQRPVNFVLDEVHTLYG